MIIIKLSNNQLATPTILQSAMSSVNIKLTSVIQQFKEKQLIIHPEHVYTKCRVFSTHLDRLPHILALYPTIKTVELEVNEPILQMPFTTPISDIKHIKIISRAKSNHKTGMLPDNIWLMFPALETIITDGVYIPHHNITSLDALSTIRVDYEGPTTKKHPSKLQELVGELEEMTTLKDICIRCYFNDNNKCQISDRLFANNSQLEYIYFANKVFVSNIPSILSCQNLKTIQMDIDISANKYILELANLEYIQLTKPDTTADTNIDQPRTGPDSELTDDMFAAPLFTTVQNKFCLYGYDARTYANGENYKSICEKLRQNQIERTNGGKKKYYTIIRHIAGREYTITC